MTFLKWIFWGLVVTVVGGMLHYTLPRYDIVRIVDTEVRRVDVPAGSLFWSNSEPATSSTGARDVKFISARYDNGRSRVLRNEDTGWGWPPYFKFDSADLQASAADKRSTQDNPNWVVIRYYGWRSNLFTIFPNALSISEATGPDMRIIPWFNIVVLGSLGAMVLLVRAAIKRFVRNRIDPVAARVADGFDNANDAADAARHRFRGKRQKLREWWYETFG